MSLLARTGMIGLFVVASACAAGSDDEAGGGAGASGGSGGSGASGGDGAGFAGGNGGGGEGGFAECATFTDEATQAPAAMLIVLDKSASMNTNNKWATAQLAVVAAIDNDAFDSLSLGLVTFPASITEPPDCLCDYIGFPDCGQLLPDGGVSCGVSGLPQVAMAPAGTMKSNAGSGVRSNIYNYLVANNPLSNSDDGSPIYAAMTAGYDALKAYDTEQRILVLVTDGGFSCTSVSSPARPGYDDGACPDWEYPDTVNTFITQNRTDPTKPINTFIVGLPGSNSAGEMQGSYATAPYHMRRALSSYAASGSPDTIDPTCDTPDATFNTSGPDPAVPCHIDLSTGAFNADALAAAITKIRGDALGCIYELPEPPPGEDINPDKVNVDTTLDGDVTHLPRRADSGDDCLDEGCWDYTSDGKVELIGKACSDVVNAANAKVDIVVGCDTVVK